MVINIINFIKINYLLIFKKLTIYLQLLINLNNINLNYLILSIIIYFIYYINFNIYIYIFIFNFKIKFIFFINSFFFGFFKIHPYMFYIAIILYVNIINKNFIKNKLTLLFNLKITILSFFLGSLWALYTFNWGKYWSNDSIEYILIFLTYIYILTIHKFSDNSIYQLIYIIKLLYLLILIRYSYIYTKHNFFNLKVLSLTLSKYYLIIFFIGYNVDYFISKNYYIKYKFMLILFIFYLYFIIFNLINNIKLYLYIKLFFIFLLIFFIITINWNLIKFITLHYSLFILTLFFIICKLQFILNFNYYFLNYNFMINIYNYNYINYKENFNYLYNNNKLYFNKIYNVINNLLLLKVNINKNILNIYV